MNRNSLAEVVRQQLVRLPEPHAAHYGVVPLPPPEGPVDVGPVRARYDGAVAALARAEALAAALPDPWVFSRVLSRREAVSSSAIEGTNSTLDELLAVEETQDEAATTAAKQVRSYALALDALVPRARERGPALFTLNTVRDLHRLVMQEDGDYPDDPGALRQRVVWIGSADIAYSTFNPPPPDRVPAALEDVLRYLRLQGDASDGMLAMNQGLITRMAISHAQFEAVHPFRDGNGRVGRLLLPLMMAAEGHLPLYLSPYIEAHKEAYYGGLRAGQQRLEWAPLIGFFSDAITGTLVELEATQAALATLRGRWQTRRRFRANSAALRALDLLPHYPVITVGRLAALLVVSFPTAALAIEQLQEAGILTERTGQRRNRIFAVAEALAIINRPFGAEPLL